MTEMAEKAADIANLLDKDVNKASVRLATEYLQMNPQEFRKLVDEIVTYTSGYSIPDVYLESGSSGTTIKFDNSILPFGDSTLLKIPTKPSSSPAERYVDLMRNASDDVEREKNATLGLISLSQRLPKSEAKALINSAEDSYCNANDSVSESPHLNVRFRDLNKDGVDDELFDVSLIYGVRSRLYRNTQTYDLYDPPAPKPSIKNVPPSPTPSHSPAPSYTPTPSSPPTPSPAPVPYHSPFQKTLPSSSGSKTNSILDDLAK